MCEEILQAGLMTERMLSDSISDEEATSVYALIERAKAGDSTAFDQIMLYSQHKVISLAWRILGNEDDARDATQEVFLRVYKYLDSYKKEHDFHAWIYRITINVCYNLAKKKKRREDKFTSIELEREFGTFDFLASPENTENTVVLRQQREAVADALKTLPEKERVALVLRDIEGLSTEEVAKIMNSAPTTIRVQISSARKKLKFFCNRYFGEGEGKDL